jgi:hypothetical protein
MFSGWQDETEQDWARNRQQLQGYEIVDPWYPAAPLLDGNDIDEPF